MGDLRQRTKKGIETARLNGKIIGRPKGQHSVSEREVRAKRQMMKSVRSVGDDIKKNSQPMEQRILSTKAPTPIREPSFILRRLTIFNITRSEERR